MKNPSPMPPPGSIAIAEPLRLLSGIADGGFSLLIPAMDDSGACACECDLDGDHGDSTDHNIEFTVLVQLLLLLRTGGPSPRGAAVPGTGLTNLPGALVGDEGDGGNSVGAEDVG